MKKSIIFFTIVVTAFFVGFFCLNNSDNTEINVILKSKSYAYLPDEAKDYVKDIYKKTGEVILTEKNKEENKPYLNPEYINYLELSGKEKENVVLVPDTYILDYSVSETYSNSDFPSSYDLRNLNGYNFVSPVKNQGTTNICWAFATVQNVETLYMKSNNQSYSDLIPKFSIRQMDYITSTGYDGNSSRLAKDANWSSGMCTNSSCSWTPWDNPDNGSHELAKGGNFFVSSIAMANAVTLTDESVMPWHEGVNPVWAKDVYGFDKTLYEVDSTISMPTINGDSATTALIDSYVADIKKYTMQYGGPFVGTYSPKSTCGFENKDGKKVLKTDDCVRNSSNSDLGHAMQIIGWDDNYSYSYCDDGTTHYSVGNGDTCSKGELTSGKGAWILKNSWGTETEEAQEYSYVYLTYDSTRLSIGFTTSLSDMKTRTWDNNYHSNPWIERKISNGMLSVESQTKEFDTHNNNSEKIEKIKFFTSSKNGEYNISVLTDSKNYNNVGTVSTTEAGIYTINLSDKDIILEDRTFSVKIEGQNGVEFFNDSISVFTSNTTDEPSFETKYVSGLKMYEDPDGVPSENNVAFITASKGTTVKIEHYLKNVPDYKKVTYKALLDGVDHSIYFFDDYSLIPYNMIYLDGYLNTTLEISKEDYSDVEVCGKVYTFQILYDDVVIESFPLKRICDNWDGDSTDYTTSKIRYHKNDGSGYFTTVTGNDTTNIKIMNSDGTGSGYIGGDKGFFLYDRYIKSWNTKPDGTGETYIDNLYFIYKDVDLYAQWSDPDTEKHQYIMDFKCNRYICHESLILSKEMKATFNEEFTMPINSFTNLTDGQEFIYWAFDSDDLDNIFYEEEKVKNITNYGFSSPYNNDEHAYLEAVWSDSYYTVSFNANNGTGSMKDIKIITDRASRLKYNLFKREGYDFKGWNTKADGTGIEYTDGQKISLTEDITLYAQWEENTSFEIKDYQYDEEKGFITGISPDSSNDEYLAKFVLGDIYTAEIISTNNYVYTGSTVNIYKNGALFKEITNIVSGDTNGDGTLSVLDIVKINNHIVDTSKKLSEIYALAGDYNNDGGLSVLDIVKINNAIVGGN